jgi:hypothetical protein
VFLKHIKTREWQTHCIVIMIMLSVMDMLRE